MTTPRYTRLAIAAIASIAFAIGCVTEALIVPPVRAGTNPTRWEYKCLVAMDPEEDGNKLGMQGWELAAVTGGRWCFKRPLP